MFKQISKQLTQTKAEAGQAIVFIALFMVMMLGMLGLAIDGGGLFFLWRDAQGAADAAVISAAYSQCAGGDTAQVKARGLSTADRNGFSNTNPDHEVRVIIGNEDTAQVEDRKTGEMVSEQEFIQRRLNDAGQSSVSPDNYVYVDILAEKPSFFIQVLYDGALTVSPAAMSRCNPKVDSSNVPGMLAFGVCSGQTELKFSGAGAYFDGDMHSNGDVRFTPSAHGTTLDSGTDVSYIGSLQHESGIKHRNPDRENFQTPTTGTVSDPVGNPLYNEAEIRELYGPGGTVSAQLPADEYTYHPSDASFSDGDQGLHFVEGQATVDLNTVGSRGLTVIAMEDIDIKPMNNTGNWYYYKGLENFQYPYFVGVSMINSEGNEDCSKGGNGFSMKGQGNPPSSKDYSTGSLPFNPPNVTGVIYVPYAAVSASAAAFSVEGMMIAWRIDFSMADGAFRQNSSFIPSRPPSVQNIPVVGN